MAATMVLESILQLATVKSVCVASLQYLLLVYICFYYQFLRTSRKDVLRSRHVIKKSFMHGSVGRFLSIRRFEPTQTTNLQHARLWSVGVGSFLH